MSDTEAPTIEAPLSPSQFAKELFGNEYIGEVEELPVEEVAEEPTEEVAEVAEEEVDEATDEAPEETAEEDDGEVPISSIQELIESNEWDSEWFNTLEVPVKINGEEGKAAFADLVASYQTQEAATKRLEDSKTKAAALNQELADKQAEVESHFAAVAKLIEKNENMLNQDIAAIDWKQLENEDPADAALKKVKLGERQQELEKLKREAMEEYQTSISSTRQEQEQARQEALQAEGQKLLELFPDWKDPEKRQAGQSQISAYLAENAFSPEEIGSASDSRIIQLAHKAMLYDKGMAKTEVAKKRIAKVPKTLKPGATKSADQINTEKRQAQMAKLQKSGNFDDALALLNM